MIDVIEGDGSDVASIMPIMEDAFDPAFGEAWTSAQCLATLAMPGCRLLIAKHANEICGFSMSRWVLDTEELLMIGVARKWQRQKIGARLLTTTIDLARNEKRSQLFLEVRDGNHAQDFYTSIGFHPVGRRENYYRGSDGFCPDAITMSFVL